MSEALDILLKRRCRCVIGRQAYEILEPTIRQYFHLSDWFKRLSLMINKALKTTDGYNVKVVNEIYVLVIYIVRKIIKIDDESLDDMTPRQLVYIIYFLTSIYIDTKKLEAEIRPGGETDTDDKYSMLGVFEQFSNQYGWTIDKILDSFTIRQFYVYWKKQQNRTTREAEFVASCHGLKLTKGGSQTVNVPPDSKIAAPRDEITKNIGVNVGDVEKLKKLMLYMGIHYPQDINLGNVEGSLRNIADLQIKQLRGSNKWVPPNFRRDILYQVCGVKSDDTNGILKKANELGVKLGVGFDVIKHHEMIVMMLCVMQRKKEGYLEELKASEKPLPEGQTKIIKTVIGSKLGKE
jgi:hypothetical protein